MDKFFTQTKCDRCGCSLEQGRTMSIFNTECICMTCKDKERTDPRYKEAVAKEREETLQGNLSYLGIDNK